MLQKHNYDHWSFKMIRVKQYLLMITALTHPPLYELLGRHLVDADPLQGVVHLIITWMV